MIAVSRRAFTLSLVAMPLGALSYQALATNQRVGARRAPKRVELCLSTDGDLLAFKPDLLTCPAGSHVRLTFMHAGKYVRQEHDWVLTVPGAADAVAQAGIDAGETAGYVPRNDPRVLAATATCSRGGRVSVDFLAPTPGDYPFICTNPGHAAVMRGILRVVPA